MDEPLTKHQTDKLESIIDIDSTETRLDNEIFNNLMETKISRNLIIKFILVKLRQLERDNN